MRLRGSANRNSRARADGVFTRDCASADAGIGALRPDWKRPLAPFLPADRERGPNRVLPRARSGQAGHLAGFRHGVRPVPELHGNDE